MNDFVIGVVVGPAVFRNTELPRQIVVDVTPGAVAPIKAETPVGAGLTPTEYIVEAVHPLPSVIV